MEEMDNAANLVFWHIWCQHETLKTKPVKEKFDSVGLDHIIAQNYSFALHNCELDKAEQQNELVKVAVT